MSEAQRWEYKVVQWTGSIWGTGGEWEDETLKDFSTEQVLNHYAWQGWEFVSIGPVHSKTSSPAAAYIFRRPLA